MSEIQRDYQRNRERDVFGIEERVGIEARMQQEHQHSQQRHPAAAQHPIGEHSARKAARDKEQVGKHVARQIDVAGVLQPKRALNQQQRHIKRHAVVAISGNVIRLG